MMAPTTSTTSGDSGELSQPRTILLVEDDELVRLSTRDALELLGYHVIAESNGADALARLRRDDEIDILFTDGVMPSGMSGLVLAREARALRPGLRILLASGHARDGLASERELAEFTFLAKPYRLQELAATLRALKPTGSEDGRAGV